MILLPVISRELRVSARHAFTYYLRAIGVAALLLACLGFGLERGFGSSRGSELFSSLHVTLFGAIWILVPLLTADCISRERREGTLGLLFLTRLKATDIVSAKALAHALRALTLWLAVLPVLTLPFLLGGVSWIEALLSAAINFSGICLALGAGLLASAYSKRPMRAVLATGAISVVLFFMFGMVVGQIMVQSLTGSPGFQSARSNSDFVWLTGLGVITGMTNYLRFFSPSVTQLLWGVALVFAVSLLGLLLAIVLAGSRLRRVWQERSASKLEIWWQHTFCTPRFLLSVFRPWMARKLEHNPVGWLEQRTWSARIVTWGWFAVIVSLYSAALRDNNFFRSSQTQSAMAWLLAASLSISAAGSFRRERETGLLELLLVSPLRETDIISGRLRGLWGQFLPAFVLLLAVWFYLGTVFPDTGDPQAIMFHFNTFLTLPVIGLYYSLRCRTFLVAFITTISVGFIAPLVLVGLFRFIIWFYERLLVSGGPRLRVSGDAAVVQIMIAAFCGRALYRRLKTRAFSFNS